MTFPIAAAVLNIAWGVASLPAGASVDAAVLDELRWGTDYLTACMVTSSSLVVQAWTAAPHLAACCSHALTPHAAGSLAVSSVALRGVFQAIAQCLQGPSLLPTTHQADVEACAALISSRLVHFAKAVHDWERGMLHAAP